MPDVKIAITSGTRWRVPADCKSATFECIGGGSVGGGAYSKVNNLAVTPGTYVYCQIGSGGYGGDGGDTWVNINTSNFTAPTNRNQGCLAKGGQMSGPGGNRDNCIGDTSFSGGRGFSESIDNCGELLWFVGSFGGAAGPDGPGGNGYQGYQGGGGAANNGSSAYGPSGANGRTGGAGGSPGGVDGSRFGSVTISGGAGGATTSGSSVGGMGGGAINNVTAPTRSNSANGGTGATPTDFYGLSAALSGTGYSLGTGGAGNTGTAGAAGNNAHNGGNASGIGAGGGGAYRDGGQGGSGSFGGGGGGAAGYTNAGNQAKFGGNGGNGVVIVRLNNTTTTVLISGTSFIIPGGTTSVQIWAIGGGGGGGGASLTNTSTSGGGGGAGGMVYYAYPGTTVNQTMSYTLGGGGIGRAALDGNPGGTTTVTVNGQTLTANGGSPGLYNSSTASSGGSASRTIVSTLTIDAATGGDGLSAPRTQGGGGGGGINNSNPPARTPSTTYGGAGANANDFYGLSAALSGTGYSLGTGGAGGLPSTLNPGGNNGGSGIGIGAGGGGAGINGGAGGGGGFGGGGGGAFYYNSIQAFGGYGGSGIIIIRLNNSITKVLTNYGGGIFVIPNNTTSIKIWAIGAGGGGGDSNASSGDSGAGGGAGAIIYYEHSGTFVTQYIRYNCGVAGRNGNSGEATIFTFNNQIFRAEGGKGGGAGTVANPLGLGGSSGIGQMRLMPANGSSGGGGGGNTNTNTANYFNFGGEGGVGSPELIWTDYSGDQYGPAGGAGGSPSFQNLVGPIGAKYGGGGASGGQGIIFITFTPDVIIGRSYTEILNEYNNKEISKWRIPYGVTSITVRAIGSGSYGITNSTFRNMGGGGGAYAESKINVSSLNNQAAYYIVKSEVSIPAVWFNKGSAVQPTNPSDGVLAKSAADSVGGSDTDSVGTVKYSGGNGGRGGGDASGALPAKRWGGGGGAAGPNGAGKNGGWVTAVDTTAKSGSGGGGGGANGGSATVGANAADTTGAVRYKPGAGGAGSTGDEGGIGGQVFSGVVSGGSVSSFTGTITRLLSIQDGSATTTYNTNNLTAGLDLNKISGTGSLGDYPIVTIIYNNAQFNFDTSIYDGAAPPGTAVTNGGVLFAVEAWNRGASRGSGGGGGVPTNSYLSALHGGAGGIDPIWTDTWSTKVYGPSGGGGGAATYYSSSSVVYTGSYPGFGGTGEGSTNGFIYGGSGGGWGGEANGYLISTYGSTLQTGLIVLEYTTTSSATGNMFLVLK